jgi:hypothetical protein
MALSAFFFGFTTALQLPTIPLFDGYFEILQRFFSSEADRLPSSSSNLFLLCLNRLLRAPTDEVSPFLELISKTARDYPNCFAASTI